MFRILFLIITLVMILTTDANSKCPMVKWKFSGTVKSSVTSQPINGAQIFVFLDENESTNSNGRLTKYPDYFVTNEDGNFDATSFYDSFSRWNYLEGDVCNKKPRTVEIIVTKSGFLTKRIKYSISDLKVLKEKDVF